MGLSSPDDSAVYRLDSERAIISTVDFFPPVVDDAYDFGAIAAANALSDVYAMGGEPLLAINLVAYPDEYGVDLLREILRGGAEKAREAGVVIAGGHTVTDKEPKYGLAVTGMIHPDKIITKKGARPGDKLILTKALGTGVITTALKNQSAADSHVAAAVKNMSRLNGVSSRLAQQIGVHAMTDITGYALLGHSCEMVQNADVDFCFSYNTFHWLPGAEDYARREIFPGGMRRNRDYFEQWIQWETNLSEYQQNLLFDPQTSGGLLIAVTAEKADTLFSQLLAAGETAAIVGDVRRGSGKIKIFV